MLDLWLEHDRHVYRTPIVLAAVVRISYKPKVSISCCLLSSHSCFYYTLNVVIFSGCTTILINVS